MPAHGLASVTVVGPDLAMADAYTTTAVAHGQEGVTWLAEQPGVEAMGITDAQRVVSTPGFDRYRAS